MDDPANRPERLSSWKEIAAHLSVSVRTAQRWERTESLPARRHQHGVLGSVFAYKSELDAWWNSRPQLRQSETDNRPVPQSIAVLPFTDLDRISENEIFSDGLTEELISTLAQVDGLKVVARTSAFHFKGKTADIRAIGARLGVRTILEGSVRRADNRLRITAQLINAADGCHLWSQRFDRRMQDVFDLQEELAHGIAEALRVKLTGRATRNRGSNLDSYALYLEGRHHWNKRTPAGHVKAVECFERALAGEPRMALAWAGLADCYALVAVMAGSSSGEAVRKARTAALKALEIDGSLAEAHTPLAFIAATFDYDWETAEAHFRRALESNPNHADAHLLYAATVLGALGRLDEASGHQRRAWELDPLSAVMTGAMGTMAVMFRHFDEAISACRRALELDPTYPWAHRSMGEAYLMKGLFGDAERVLSRIESPLLASGFLGYCYARTSREPEARQLLSKLNATGNPALGLQMGIIHLGLGEFESAVNEVQKALEVGGVPGIHWLSIEPIWDALRSHRHFAELLRRWRLGN